MQRVFNYIERGDWLGDGHDGFSIMHLREVLEVSFLRNHQKSLSEGELFVNCVYYRACVMIEGGKGYDKIREFMAEMSARDIPLESTLIKLGNKQAPMWKTGPLQISDADNRTKINPLGQNVRPYQHKLFERLLGHENV